MRRFAAAGALIIAASLAAATGASAATPSPSYQLGGLGALLVYLPLVGGSWLALSLQLSHRDARWPELVPGALLVGGGLLCVNAFNVYVTTRLVEGQANTYGALGVAAALLFSLVLVGRLVIVAAELGVVLQTTRRRQ